MNLRSIHEPVDHGFLQANPRFGGINSTATCIPAFPALQITTDYKAPGGKR